MNMKTIKKQCAVLCAGLSLGLLVSCAGEENIVGTWAADVEMSVLGLTEQIDSSIPITTVYVFGEDGSGSFEMQMPDDLPNPGTQPFQYTVEEEKLTLLLENGQSQEYEFVLEGDQLTLAGRVSATFKRQK